MDQITPKFIKITFLKKIKTFIVEYIIDSLLLQDVRRSVKNRAMISLKNCPSQLAFNWFPAGKTQEIRNSRIRGLNDSSSKPFNPRSSENSSRIRRLANQEDRTEMGTADHQK